MYTLYDDKHSDMFAKSVLHAYRKKSDIKYQVSAKRLGRNICHSLPNDVNDRLHGTTFLAFLVRFSFGESTLYYAMPCFVFFFTIFVSVCRKVKCTVNVWNRPEKGTPKVGQRFVRNSRLHLRQLSVTNTVTPVLRSRLIRLNYCRKS